MTDDRQAIQQFFIDWQEASQRKDLPALERMMADDVIFLRAGHPPMIGTAAFADSFKAVSHSAELVIQDWRVEEIALHGDLACCWTYLALKVSPPNGNPAMQMAGNIMSVLRKLEDGRWVLSRDANMLLPVREPCTDGLSLDISRSGHSAEAGST
jgi:uncharacterized protein (TIGR02246 family)